MHATTNNKDAYVFWPGGYIQVISLYVVTYELLISEGLLSYYMHTLYVPFEPKERNRLRFHSNDRCTDYHFTFLPVPVFQKFLQWCKKRIIVIRISMSCCSP